tara:strand:- start:143 stop:1105 length:963 start_codon:yes stop_codon:yes gene_type:complete
MVVLTQTIVNEYCSILGISRENLKEFVIPNSVTKINDNAFDGCSALTSVTIPDSVTEIGGAAFFFCSSLTSINIPDSVTTIGEYAFSNCYSLKTVTFSNNITEINDAAFFRCTSLESIILPNGITKIGDGAFQSCTALTSIIIPDSVTKIEFSAFLNSSLLRKIVCSNPALFTNMNIEDKDQIEFISTTDYFNDNYQDLLSTIESSGLNIDSLSNKELNLLMRLDQEDYLPKWETIATTFNERSIDQIHSILHYFNKTSCMPDTENSILLQKKDEDPITLDGISMFLNPKDHANLSMTAKKVILKPQEQEHEGTSFCSIQ